MLCHTRSIFTQVLPRGDAVPCEIGRSPTFVTVLGGTLGDQRRFRQRRAVTARRLPTVGNSRRCRRGAEGSIGAYGQTDRRRAWLVLQRHQARWSAGRGIQPPCLAQTLPTTWDEGYFVRGLGREQYSF